MSAGHITVAMPNAAAALREWRAARSATSAAEKSFLLLGRAEEGTLRVLRAAERELRTVAFMLMESELQRAQSLTTQRVRAPAEA